MRIETKQKSQTREIKKCLWNPVNASHAMFFCGLALCLLLSFYPPAASQPAGGAVLYLWLYWRQECVCMLCIHLCLPLHVPDWLFLLMHLSGSQEPELILKVNHSCFAKDRAQANKQKHRSLKAIVECCNKTINISLTIHWLEFLINSFICIYSK